MEAVKLMRGPVGSSIELTVRRKEVKKSLTFNIKRQIIEVKSVESKILGNKKNIGYIKLKSFNLIGINNRDLKTFKTDLKTSIELMHSYADIFLKQNIIPISESGINCAEDLESLRSIGIMGVLIGETFMRETNIEQSFKKLFNSI